MKRVFGGIQHQEMAPQVPLVYRYTKNDAKSLRAKYHKMYLGAVHDLGLPKNEFEEVFSPIIQWLSEYLIYLPASEHYHHIEPGAFFLHCIQTANKAAQIAGNNSSLFFNIAVEDRGSFQRNFTFAAWLGGLIHDVGKPVADMSVYAVNRDQVWLRKIPVWNPLEQTLDLWARTHNVRWYRVVFIRNKEMEHHESYIIPFVTKIIEKLNNSSINKKAIFDFLIGINNPTSKIYPVVKKADEMSTQHDIQRYDKVGVFNTPIAHFVRALVDYEFEHSNQSKKPYFRSEIGIHINHPTGLKTIVEYMFSRFTKEDIAYLKVSSDLNFWIEMLRNHRFLVADVDTKDKRIGEYNYIAPYIFDINTIDGGVEQTHTCITMTRDNRVPLNVEELELKRVNIVKRQVLNDKEENEKAQKPKKTNVGKVKNTKINNTNEEKENVSVSTDTIHIIESKEQCHESQYVTTSINDEVSSLDFNLPEIDCELNGGEISELENVDTSEIIVEQTTDEEQNLLALNPIAFDRNNLSAKMILNNYPNHEIVECCYDEEEWASHPELVLSLIYLYEYIKLNKDKELYFFNELSFTQNGVHANIRLFSTSRNAISTDKNNYPFNNQLNSKLLNYATSNVNQDNLLITNFDRNIVTFKSSIAKMFLFPIKEKIKALIESGDLILTDDDREG